MDGKILLTLEAVLDVRSCDTLHGWCPLCGAYHLSSDVTSQMTTLHSNCSRPHNIELRGWLRNFGGCLQACFSDGHHQSSRMNGNPKWSRRMATKGSPGVRERVVSASQVRRPCAWPCPRDSQPRPVYPIAPDVAACTCSHVLFAPVSVVSLHECADHVTLADHHHAVIAMIEPMHHAKGWTPPPRFKSVPADVKPRNPVQWFDTGMNLCLRVAASCVTFVGTCCWEVQSVGDGETDASHRKVHDTTFLHELIDANGRV